MYIIPTIRLKNIIMILYKDLALKNFFTAALFNFIIEIRRFKGIKTLQFIL